MVFFTIITIIISLRDKSDSPEITTRSPIVDSCIPLDVQFPVDSKLTLSYLQLSTGDV